MTRPRLAEFLSAFRETANANWQDFQPETLADFRARGVGGVTWAAGTRWRPGLAEDQIAEIEESNGIDFPADYRAFLSILNAPDRPAHRYGYAGAKLLRAPDEHVFTDWPGNPRAQEDYLNHIIEGILFDVENNGVWFDTWGPRTSSAEARRDRVTELARDAPRLVRLCGHRFLISGTGLSPDPVISAVQTDFIVYAWSIEECLSKDFPSFAPALPVPELSEETTRLHFNRLGAIRFWGQFLS